MFNAETYNQTEGSSSASIKNNVLWGNWNKIFIISFFNFLQAQAASTPLYCATSPELKGMSDAYYKDCKRSEESELAQNLHLSFRIYDLTRELLHDRNVAKDEPIRVEEVVGYQEPTKHAIDESMVANLSG